MNAEILTAVGILSGLGIVSGILLYVIAKKFHVEEDPRIDEVEKNLPGANCGACGFAGCRNFSEACVKTENMEVMFCPVGGNTSMARIAQVLGKTAIEKAAMIAVVRCNGCDKYRPRRNRYDAVPSCAIANHHYQGETDCAYGCFGFGDCVRACPFDAIKIDTETGLPVVDEDKCTACGACVKACPRSLIEMRLKGPKGRRVYVRCMNKDKAVLTRKACQVGCIGCGKCVKVCPFDAITVTNNLAYINYDKCKLCRKCVAVCPTKAINEVNFPQKTLEIQPPDKMEVSHE